MKPLLTIPEFAELLGVKRGWVAKRVSARRIQFTPAGRYIRFSEADVDAFIATNVQKPITTSPTRIGARRPRPRQGRVA